MKAGPYAVTHETIAGLLLNPYDSLRIGILGIPRLPGHTSSDVAKQVLRKNAHEVLWAGTGHFRFLWVSDFAKAFRGARCALSPGYLRGQIELMIRHSARKGYVTSCFTADRGFDMPYARGDGLPWLVFAAAEWLRWTGDKGFLNANRAALQPLVSAWEATHFEDGLISPRITGDWMDTLLRPSSTYNNVCALMALRRLPELGLKTSLSADDFEKRLVESRWRGQHLTDYAGTEDWSVDAAVYALYFELFDEAKRRAMARKLEESGLTEPFPIRSAPRDYDRSIMPPLTRLTPRYHSVIWLHLGFMYLNGLKRLGRDVGKDVKKLDELIMRYRNVLETIDADGKPYRTLLHSTEHGLTMAAGQYLELVCV